MLISSKEKATSGFSNAVTTFTGQKYLSPVIDRRSRKSSITDDEKVSGSDNDSDWDTDLEGEDTPKKEHDASGLDVYLAICKREQITPSKCITENLKRRTVTARHRRFSVREFKAMVGALWCNTFVTKLDLEDNDIKTSSLIELQPLFRDNCYLTELSLAENAIGTDGSHMVAKIIRETRCLEKLNLQGNKFQEKDAELLGDALAVNDTLRVLNLSHNEFQVEGGKRMGMAIQENTTLYELDLSWNHLRMSGAIAIADGLKQNNSIKKLNLAFNGFSDNGAQAIAKALDSNDTLEWLDMTYNRISNIGAKFIGSSLTKNTTLEILKIGSNPITAAGAFMLLQALQHSETLIELEMKDIVIDINSAELVRQLLQERSGLKIQHGGICNAIYTGKRDTPEEVLKRQIFSNIRSYLNEKKLRMLDLFNQWDKDKSLSLTADEFRVGMKAAKFPLTENMLAFLIKMLDLDGNGEVEYSEFVAVSNIE